MESSKQETSLWIALNRLHRMITISIDSKLKSEGLPPLKWYDILWELDKVSDVGMRPFELENKLIFLQSNLSRLLRRMIDEGLIDELSFEGDSRGKTLRITAAGQELRKKMWVVYGFALNKHMSLFPKEYDIDKITRAFDRVVESE